MNILELFFIAVGLSMDAFAVSVVSGIAIQKSHLKKALVIGFYFGIFQTLMPIAGYLASFNFTNSRMVTSFDHWIAFLILSIIGIKMIKESQENDNSHNIKEFLLKPSKMIILSIATSIDAFAVGISFAFLKTKIIPDVFFIGAVTFLLSIAGVIAGNSWGRLLKSKSEIAGGIILILIGLKILFGHLGII